MPLDSTGRFLIASVRAVRSFKKHLHLAFYQEPVRRPLRPLGLLGPSGLLGLLGLLKPSVQLIQSVQLRQLGQLK